MSQTSNSNYYYRPSPISVEVLKVFYIDFFACVEGHSENIALR